MTSTILSACVKCGDLPTSIVMFSADNYATCAGAFLCKKCAPTVAYNQTSTADLLGKGWRVGTTKLKGRPRRLETDPRWKHKPTLEHELIRYFLTHMSQVSAKDMAKRLPQFLLDKVVDQFLSSSSRLSVHCARVLRQTAFKRTPEVNMRDMGLNDSDMKLVAYFATRDSHITHTLDVSWNRMGQRGAKSMATALLLVRNLRTLNLSWTLFGDSGMRLLEHGVARNISLTALNLAGCRLSAHAAPSIAHVLAQNTTLLDLNLGFNELRRIGSQRVAQGLARNSTLTRLSLRSNKLGREGAVAIAKALTGNEAMFHVNIADNNIGELGAQAMASLTTIKTVELVRGIMPDFDEQQAKKTAQAAERLAKQTELALVAALGRVGSLDNVHEYDAGIDTEDSHESKEGGGTYGTGAAGSDDGGASAGTGKQVPVVPRLRLSERDLDEAARRVAQQRAARRHARGGGSGRAVAGDAEGRAVTASGRSSASASGRKSQRSDDPSGAGERLDAAADGGAGLHGGAGVGAASDAAAEHEADIRAAAAALMSGRSYDPGV